MSDCVTTFGRALGMLRIWITVWYCCLPFGSSQSLASTLVATAGTRTVRSLATPIFEVPRFLLLAGFSTTDITPRSTDDAVIPQLLAISETPFAITSACIPCSMYLVREAIKKTCHLYVHLQSSFTSRQSRASPEIVESYQQQPGNLRARDSDGFVQLQEDQMLELTSFSVSHAAKM